MKYLKKIYQDLDNKFDQLGISSKARSGFIVLILDGWGSFQNIYNKKIPKLIKQNIKNLENVRSILYSMQVEYDHLERHIKDAKKSFNAIEKFLDRKIDKKIKARPTLNNVKIIEMIKKCINKKINVNQLFNWSLNHINDRYEKKYRKSIEEIMSKLAMAKHDKAMEKIMSQLGIAHTKTRFVNKDLKLMIKKLRTY